MSEKISLENFTSDQKEMIDIIVEWIKKGSKQSLKIGGCAGTGKTTVIANLAKIVYDRIGKYPKIAYCAFTGKAAKVMRDKGMTDASTVHSLIYHAEVTFNEETGFLEHSYKLKDRLDCDLIVVDEASTIGQELHQDLNKFGIKILYVGDYAQLPPVGNDINLMEEDQLDFKLLQIHRQAENSGIIRISMAIRNGDEIAYHHGPDTMKIRAKDFDFKNLLNFDQVISGKNATRVYLNMRMRKLYGFNDDSPCRKDKIIFLYNDKKREIYNGQQAIITDIKKTKDGNFHIKYVDIDEKEKGIQECIAYGKTFNSEKGMKDVKMTKNEWKKNFAFCDYGYTISCHKCVIGSTIIDTINGKIRIDNYNGEKIDDGNGNFIVPSNFYMYENCKTIKIITEKRKTLTATLFHRQPIFNNGIKSIVYFHELDVGDVVKTKDGYEKIVEILNSGVHDVYCLTVDTTNEFWQNDILSGNSQGSEWNNVCLIDDQFGYWDETLRRRYLYTAITRSAKNFVWVDGIPM